MKLVFEAPYGRRLHRYFNGIQLESYNNLWWSYDDKRWMPLKHIKGPASTSAPCKTLKAFKRHLRKHPELHGLPVVLTNRFYNHHSFDVTVDWESDV